MCVRAEYHVCKLHGGQSIKGATYGDLHDTYQITIANYTVLPESTDFLTEFEFRDAHGKSLDGGHTRIYFLELTKLAELLRKPTGDLTRPEMWALYFKYVDDMKHREMINQLIGKEQGLAMASSMLQKLAQDDAMRVTLLSIEKAEMDYRDEMYQAREKGMKEGRQEGRQEGRFELMQSMYQVGASVDLIAKAVKMPLEDVKKILDI